MLLRGTRGLGVAIAISVVGGCSLLSATDLSGLSTPPAVDVDGGDSGAGIDARGNSDVDATTTDGATNDAGEDAGCGSPAICEIGKSCIANSDCASGYCTSVGADDAGSGVCTTTCTTIDHCVAGWTCDAVSGQTSSLCKCIRQAETCDGKDNDCDGVIDQQPAADTFCKATVSTSHVCANGQCGCGPSKLLCLGLCVDPQTDPLNCGACGAQCGEGTTCVAGKCQCAGSGPVCETKAGSSSQCTNGTCRRVTTLHYLGVFGIAAEGDGSHVMFTTNNGVFRIKEGDPEPTSFAEGSARGITIAGSTTYWLTTADQKILTCPKSGCVGSPAEFAGAGLGGASTLVSNGTKLYWPSLDGLISTCSLGGCGGGPTKPTLPTTPDPVRLTFDATNLYWTTTSGQIGKLPLAGGAGSRLVEKGLPLGITTDGTTVYFTDENAETIYKCPVSGCPGGSTAGGVVVLSDVTGLDTSIAVDGGYLYWGTRDLYRCSLASPVCTPETIATTAGGARLKYIAFDTAHIYIASATTLFQVTR